MVDIISPEHRDTAINIFDRFIAISILKDAAIMSDEKLFIYAAIASLILSVKYHASSHISIIALVRMYNF